MLAQTTALAVIVGRKPMACHTFREASELIKDFRDRNDLGSTDFYTFKDIGKIFHPDKGAFAHVSYNGRVWKGLEWKKDTEEIKDLDSSDY